MNLSSNPLNTVHAGWLEHKQAKELKVKLR